MKRLIALAGRAGSGKNTVADMLGGHQISFAEPLKRFCQEVFDFSDEQVWGASEHRNKQDGRYLRETCELGNECRSGRPHTCTRAYLTPRYALQTLGTNWGRDCFPDIWADLGVRRALARPEDLVLITDCRFTNEAIAVLRAGGEVWRIVRPGSGLTGAAALHPSEAEQESPEFLKFVTRTIYNTGTLADLTVMAATAR